MNKIQITKPNRTCTKYYCKIYCEGKPCEFAPKKRNGATSTNKQSKPLQSCSNSACEDYIGVCAGKLCEFRE